MQIDLKKHLNFRIKNDFVIDHIIDTREIVDNKEEGKTKSES
jgi:hypothetical protein